MELIVDKRPGEKLLATNGHIDSRLPPALSSCASALRRMVAYQLDPLLERKMTELGERKEFLNREEYDELMALVAFCRQRTIEKLDAQRALRELEAVFPELAKAS